LKSITGYNGTGELPDVDTHDNVPW